LLHKNQKVLSYYEQLYSLSECRRGKEWANEVTSNIDRWTLKRLDVDDQKYHKQLWGYEERKEEAIQANLKGASKPYVGKKPGGLRYRCKKQ
jgi:hypothetical protein